MSAMAHSTEIGGWGQSLLGAAAVNAVCESCLLSYLCVLKVDRAVERKCKEYGFRWNALILVDFTFYSTWDVSKCNMLCFQAVPEIILFLCCVLRATVVKYCEIRR